jgi:hypothetical protein
MVRGSVALLAVLSTFEPGLAAPIETAGAATALPCRRWTAEYALAGRVQLTDTPFGAGDGVYDVGPGKLRLQFTMSSAPNAPIAVKLLSYQMRDHIVIDARVLFFRTRVTTQAQTHAGGDHLRAAASGVLSGRTLEWTTR